VGIGRSRSRHPGDHPGRPRWSELRPSPRGAIPLLPTQRSALRDRRRADDLRWSLGSGPGRACGGEQSVAIGLVRSGAGPWRIRLSESTRSRTRLSASRIPAHLFSDYRTPSGTLADPPASIALERRCRLGSAGFFRSPERERAKPPLRDARWEPLLKGRALGPHVMGPVPHTWLLLDFLVELADLS
jgi:hypothetical protein